MLCTVCSLLSKYIAHMYAMYMFCVTCLMQCYIYDVLSVLHSWYISYVLCYVYGMFYVWCMDCAMCLSVCSIPHSYCVHVMYIVFSLCARYMVYCVCAACSMCVPCSSLQEVCPIAGPSLSTEGIISGICFKETM